MPRPLPAPALAAVLLCSLLAGAAGLAESGRQDWPQFRGPQRDGIARGAELAPSWPEAGPKVLWTIELGDGFSGISVAGGRLFTMFAESAPGVEDEGESGEETAAGEEAAAGGRELVAAFDPATGEELWRTELGEVFVNEFGNGPRATPTVDGERLYALGGQGDLLALSVADGRVLWRLSTGEAFGAEPPRFGCSTSPIVEGGTLILEVGGGEGKALAGLEAASGEVLWTALDGPPGYRSPVAMTLAGRRQIVTKVGDELLGIGPGGEVLWTHPWEAGTVAVPLRVGEDRVFFSAAGDAGAILLEIREAGGELAAEEIWASRVMKNHFNSSVALGGHIYGFDNATLKCIAAATGEQTWARRGFGKGSLIAAGEHLLVVSDRGLLVQLAASPEGYIEQGRFQALEGKSWTAPTFADGRLFLRNRTHMRALDLRPEMAP